MPLFQPGEELEDEIFLDEFPKRLQKAIQDSQFERAMAGLEAVLPGCTNLDIAPSDSLSRACEALLTAFGDDAETVKEDAKRYVISAQKLAAAIEELQAGEISLADNLAVFPDLIEQTRTLLDIALDESTEHLLTAPARKKVERGAKAMQDFLRVVAPNNEHGPFHQAAGRYASLTDTPSSLEDLLKREDKRDAETLPTPLLQLLGGNSVYSITPSHRDNRHGRTYGSRGRGSESDS